MKVNVEIDCTPLEARQFFGLPDVQPMQTAVMDKLQQQMLANIEKVSPEALMQSWFTFDPKIAERFRDMFVTMAGLGGIAHRRQEVTWPSTAAMRRRRTRLRPPGLVPDAGRGERHVRIQLQPAAVAAVDARAEGRRPSGAGACRAFSPATCRWRRCGDISENSATTRMRGKWAAISAAWRGCAVALRDRLARIHAATGRKVSIVGWSLGGVYARDLALQVPDMVRMCRDARKSVRQRRQGDQRDAALRGAVRRGGRTTIRRFATAIAGDLPVPATSIYSRTDGIVNWRTCLLRPSDTAENIEVHLASHIGLGVNPAALWAVADRLAQPRGRIQAI